MWPDELLKWYEIHKRVLPWRSTVQIPYHVLVSEIMLQQTQVSRVVEKFQEFFVLFPTIADLASASRADVLMAWKGLGYNRRAILLHELAREVAAKHNGKIPSDPKILKSLPGIGEYTAGSVASFAFNLPIPAIDVNVRRIVLRVWKGVDQGMPMGKNEEDELRQYVENMIPSGKSSDFHSALMDFGSLVCLRVKPLCSDCMLRAKCAFFPKYKENSGAVLFVAEKKEERGRKEMGKHIPNRIFRGRILNFVRERGGSDVSVSTLGCTIKKDYHTEDKEWLLELCEKLQREGYLKYEMKGSRVKMELG